MLGTETSRTSTTTETAIFHAGIDEIAAIHDAAPDVDLEVFSHGAICFCYSGLCLLSSFAMAGRSANRGMCAQP